jgi:CO dehydrogenase maturation factor
MRIAFLGKGGSGKTTTSAGFIRHVGKLNNFVLAIDADVNAHLADALALSASGGEISQLGALYGELTSYLKGTRTDLGVNPMIMTTPPSLRSNFVRCRANDPLVAKYALRHILGAGSVNLLTVGKYEQEDVGSSCYHGKLSGAISILHHLLDGPDDIVVADNTAGTDAVATSLWFAYDMRVVVVEPSKKSVQVYKDFISLLPALAETTYVVGNKVEGPEDEAFLNAQVGTDKLLGFIPLSRHLKRFEQGDTEALDKFQEEQALVYDRILATLKNQKRDWTLYLTRLRETHTKLCRDWYDAYYGLKLDEGLDMAFTYEAVITPASAAGPVLDPVVASAAPGAEPEGEAVAEPGAALVAEPSLSFDKPSETGSCKTGPIT